MVSRTPPAGAVPAASAARPLLSRPPPGTARQARPCRGCPRGLQPPSCTPSTHRVPLQQQGRAQAQRTPSAGAAPAAAAGRPRPGGPIPGIARHARLCGGCPRGLKPSPSHSQHPSDTPAAAGVGSGTAHSHSGRGARRHCRWRGAGRGARCRAEACAASSGGFNLPKLTHSRFTLLLKH